MAAGSVCVLDKRILKIARGSALICKIHVERYLHLNTLYMALGFPRHIHN